MGVGLTKMDEGWCDKDVWVWKWIKVRLRLDEKWMNIGCKNF